MESYPQSVLQVVFPEGTFYNKAPDFLSERPTNAISAISKPSHRYRFFRKPGQRGF